MLLIRGLSNLQSVGGAVARRGRDSLLLREDMTKIQVTPGDVQFCDHKTSLCPINTYHYNGLYFYPFLHSHYRKLPHIQSFSSRL